MGDAGKHLQLVLGVVTTNIKWEELSSVRLLSGVVHTLVYCTIATSVGGEIDNILIARAYSAFSFSLDISLFLFSLPLSHTHTHTIIIPANLSQQVVVVLKRVK